MTSAPRARIALVVQGPIYEQLNGHSTVDVFEFLNASPLRQHFHVVYAAWDTEPPERLETVRAYVDEVVVSAQPARWGSGNRNLQRYGVSATLDAIRHRGFAYILKTRSDFQLTERVLAAAVERAGRGFDKVLVTNVFTRYEPFHVSDMLVFSTFENVRHWFDSREVYYEDLYSPEVQFARVFVRNRQLPYPMTLLGYLEFLRDWIEVIDFNEYGITWFKDPTISRASFNRANWIIYDRDSGPTLTRLLPAGYPRRLERSRIPLAAVAMVLLLRDLLVRCTLVGGGALLDRLGIGPRFTTFRLAGARIRIKTGVATRRYQYYHVDPMGSEHDMPIGGHRRRPPPVLAADPEPPVEGRVLIRTPVLRVELLRAAPRGGNA